jgi:hypothetical protein
MEQIATSMSQLNDMAHTASMNLSHVEMSLGSSVQINRGRLARAIGMSIPLLSSISSAIACTLCAQSIWEYSMSSSSLPTHVPTSSSVSFRL